MIFANPEHVAQFFRYIRKNEKITLNILSIIMVWSMTSKII